MSQEKFHTGSASDDYNAAKITVLEGLQAVRVRPAMYIGSTDARGLHHLVYEVVDNSIDEAMAGFCDKVDIIIHMDNSVTVRDNGRGIPVDIHPKLKIPALQVVMTKLHAGGKFNNDAYKVSGGLHGVGVSCVNALSEWMEVTVRREGRRWRQKYERGVPVTQVEMIGEAEGHGTTVHFMPDDLIFETTDFSFDTLHKRFEELAYLNKGLLITCRDERSGQTHEYHAEGGLVQFVSDINNGEKGIHSVISGEGVQDKVSVEFAMQYNEGFNDKTLTFANNIRTNEGGTHLAGFKTALTRVINGYLKAQAEQQKKKAKVESLSGDDVREGLTAVVSVKLPQPQFEGQTKTKLGNSEVAGIVSTIVYNILDTYFHEHPRDIEVILEKASEAARARDAARKARDLVRRKGALFDHSLPGKLADCHSKDPSECEIFIVEGDSAGGSAKSGRNPNTQAVLPLRGKILNVERARLDRMLASDAIRSMITVMGVGVDENLDYSKLRYNKIIIMTDADVDGAHICTLMLTFFFRYYRKLIEDGHIFIAQPPLYGVRKGVSGAIKFLKDDDKLNEFLLQRLSDGVSVTAKSGDVFTGSALIGMLQQIDQLEKNVSEAENSAVSRELFLSLLRYRSILFPEDFTAGIPAEFEEWMKSLGYSLLLEKEIQEESDRVFLMVENKSGHRTKIAAEFFHSRMYRSAYGLWNALSAAFSEFPVQISSSEDSREAADIFNLRELAYEMARKGYYIQRYKGLGEMNADQLAETTMDPEKRNLLKVSIADAQAASDAIEELMGDRADLRREFIERNALTFEELDI